MCSWGENTISIHENSSKRSRFWHFTSTNRAPSWKVFETFTRKTTYCCYVVSSRRKSKNTCINSQMAKSCKLSFNSSNKIVSFLLRKFNVTYWDQAQSHLLKDLIIMLSLKFKSNVLVVLWNFKVIAKKPIW